MLWDSGFEKSKLETCLPPSKVSSPHGILVYVWDLSSNLEEWFLNVFENRIERDDSLYQT